jgi:predicted negative regulator of RcsB-dependent stress response
MTDNKILCKVHLALAFANTVKGDINVSEKILGDVLKEFSLYSMDADIISRWNFIDVLNKFSKNEYDNLTSDLFNVVAYANNANDNFTKNILKTLLAKILKDKNENKKALEILDEQVGYFAKEKIATGVLMSWYLIAGIKLVTKGTQFSLDIAAKALDIAQSPNINNYYFITLFNKLIGEIYIAKQDFESAKVYIEKSISMAKKYDMQELLVKDYLAYAKYYQELALPKSTMRGVYIKQALKMFQSSKSVPIVAEHQHLAKIIKDELNVLMSFCKMNGIVLKKNSN